MSTQWCIRRQTGIPAYTCRRSGSLVERGGRAGRRDGRGTVARDSPLIVVKTHGGWQDEAPHSRLPIGAFQPGLVLKVIRDVHGDLQSDGAATLGPRRRPAQGPRPPRTRRPGGAAQGAHLMIPPITSSPSAVRGRSAHVAFLSGPWWSCWAARQSAESPQEFQNIPTIANPQDRITAGQSTSANISNARHSRGVTPRPTDRSGPAGSRLGGVARQCSRQFPVATVFDDRGPQ